MNDLYDIEIELTITKTSEQRRLTRGLVTFFNLDNGDMANLQKTLPAEFGQVLTLLQKAVNSPTGGS